METEVSHVLYEALSCRGGEYGHTLHIVYRLYVTDEVRVKFSSLEVVMTDGALNAYGVVTDNTSVLAVEIITRKALVLGNTGDRKCRCCHGLEDHAYGDNKLEHLASLPVGSNDCPKDYRLDDKEQQRQAYLLVTLIAGTKLLIKKQEHTCSDANGRELPGSECLQNADRHEGYYHHNKTHHV